MAAAEANGGRVGDDVETPTRRATLGGASASAAPLRKLSTPEGGAARGRSSKTSMGSPSTPSPKPGLGGCGGGGGSSSAPRLFTPPGVIAAVSGELEPSQVAQLLSAASSRLIRAQTPPATLHGALAELRLSSPQPLLPLGASLDELATRHARGADNGALPDLGLSLHGGRPVTAPEGLTGALRRSRAKGPPVVPPLPLSQSGASGGLEGVGALRATLRERAAEEEALKQAAANALTTAQQLRAMVEQAERHAESDAVRAVLRTRHEEADRAVLLLKAKLENFQRNQRNAKQRYALDALSSSSSSSHLGSRGGSHGGSRGGARSATTTSATTKPGHEPGSPAAKPCSPAAASTATSDDATSWPWSGADGAAASGGAADAATGGSRPGTAATSMAALPAAAPAAAAAATTAAATLPQGASASPASDASQTLQRSKSAASWNLARDNVAQAGNVPLDTPPASLLVYGGKAYGRGQPKPEPDDDDRDHREKLMAWRDSMLNLMKRELAGEVDAPKPVDLLRHITAPN